MLTLDHGKPMAEWLGLDARPDRVADYAIDPDMPMACESQVADAVCHLLSGFLIVEGLGETSRQPRRSLTALAVTAQNISTVLEELNECSLGFCAAVIAGSDPGIRTPTWVPPALQMQA